MAKKKTILELPATNFQKMVINNPFFGKFKLIITCKKKEKTITAAKKISKELNIPYQIARIILSLSERSLRRLCDNVN